MKGRSVEYQQLYISPSTKRARGFDNYVIFELYLSVNLYISPTHKSLLCIPYVSWFLLVFMFHLVIPILWCPGGPEGLV